MLLLSMWSTCRAQATMVLSNERKFISVAIAYACSAAIALKASLIAKPINTTNPEEFAGISGSGHPAVSGELAGYLFGPVKQHLAKMVTHGSKVILVPLNGVAFDDDMQKPVKASRTPGSFL